MISKRLRPLHDLFYLAMALLIAGIVVSGFSRTVGPLLLHAVPARPWILALHVIVFSGWIVFFLVQSALVRVRRVALHRSLGWFGVGLGVSIPVIGLSTALHIDRLNLILYPRYTPQITVALLMQVFDLLCFTVPFALAMVWRRQPERHRRLTLIATCTLTAAAFARIPHATAPVLGVYFGTDGLLLLGVLRDLAVSRRVHPVYLWSIPILMTGQIVVIHIIHTKWSPWYHLAHAILA